MDLSFWLEIAQGRFLTALLLFARIGALLFSAPLLSNRSVPTPIKVGLAATTALVLTPLFPPTMAPSLPLLLASLAKETLVGLVLGWTATLLFSCIQIAGEWLDVQSGFQAAQLFNPLFQTGTGPLGNLLYILAGLLFLHLGGAALLLRTVAESFWISPPGALPVGVGAPADWAALVTKTIWIAILLAAPVGVALFLAEMALSLINRALPQMNILMLSLPVKALLATAALIAALPSLGQTLQGVIRYLDAGLHSALRMMGS